MVAFELPWVSYQSLFLLTRLLLMRSEAHEL